MEAISEQNEKRFCHTYSAVFLDVFGQSVSGPFLCLSIILQFFGYIIWTNISMGGHGF